MAEPSGASKIVRLRAEDLTWREVDGQIVLLDLAENRYVSINGTGVLLWDQIVHGTTMGGLAQTIIQHYDDLDPTTAEADVSRFVDSLATHGLLA